MGDGRGWGRDHMTHDHDGRDMPEFGAARWPTLQVGAPEPTSHAARQAPTGPPVDVPPQHPGPVRWARSRGGSALGRLRQPGGRVRGLLGAGVLAALFVGAVAVAADEFGRTTAFGGSPGTSEVHLRAAGLANLTITAGRGPDVSWSTTSAFGAGCEAAPTAGEGIATVVLTCDPSWWGGSDAEIFVPPTARLVVDSPHTDVRVTGQLAGVTLATGDGDVDLDGVDGNVTVSTSGGDVGGTVRAADALAVTTGDGDVQLRFDGVVTATTVRTGDGSVALTVPTGGPYRLDVPADSSSDLDSDASSPRAITVTTVDGDVELRK